MSQSLLEAAVEAGDGVMAHLASIGQGTFKGLKANLQYVQKICAEVAIDLNASSRLRLKHEENPKATVAEKKLWRAERKKALEGAQATYDKLKAEKDLAHFFQNASESIKNQRFRTACWRMAAMIGIAIAATFTAGVAAEAIGGALMSAEGVTAVAELSGTARAVIVGTNMATDVLVNSAGQSIIQDQSFGEALLQNAIMAVAGMALFGTLGKIEAAAARSEARMGAAVGMAPKAAAKFGELGAMGKSLYIGKEALAITGHTIWGAAIGYASGRITDRLMHKDGISEKPTDMEAREWLMQGAAVAIGRRVHASLGEKMPGLERMAKQSTRAKQAMLDAKRLMLLADGLEKTKSSAGAADLLDERLRLLEEETRAIEELAAHEGDPKGEYAKQKAELAEQIHESKSQAMLDTKMRLSGLQELIPGVLWKGTKAAAHEATEMAQRQGGKVTVDKDGAPTIEIDGRVMKIEVNDDSRAKVAHGQEKQLAEQLGVPEVVISNDLDNGVKVETREVPGALGKDIEVVRVRVGKNATLADIHEHANQIQRITHYNGAVGKLRGLWVRFGARGGGAGNPFRPGSTGFHAFEEMRKIDQLIEARRSGWDPRNVNPELLRQEALFLEGEYERYERVIKEGESAGLLGDGPAEYGMPDVREVTNEALAAKYRLPDRKSPENSDYYYRRKAGQKDAKKPEYDLVLKAGRDAEPKRAVVEDGKFVGFEDGGDRKGGEAFTKNMQPAQIADFMLANSSLGPYVSMLEKLGLATHDQVRDQIRKQVSDARSSNRDVELNEDTLRDNAKRKYSEPVKGETESAVDKKLRGLSHDDLIKLIGQLDNGDRGHLAEVWYRLNHAPNAESQVRVGRVKVDAENDVERRIDLLKGTEMIEVKYVKGDIDHDQFEAYLKMLSLGRVKGNTFESLRYVFIDPRGMIQNAEWIASVIGKRANVTIEYYDFDGSRKSATGAQEIRDAGKKLRSKQAKED